GLARGAALGPHLAVGRGEQADDQAGVREQRLEGGLGEGAGAHHHNTHGGSCGGGTSGGPDCSSSRRCFSISSSGGIPPFSCARRKGRSKPPTAERVASWPSMPR